MSSTPSHPEVRSGGPGEGLRGVPASGVGSTLWARARLARILAVAAAAATWVLLLVGCLVHGTGSSLACPDWPLCFGSLFPKMVNGVQYEHTHRLVATAVGLITIALAAALHRRRGEDRLLARLGYVGVGLVCFQGLLGGVTVLLRLPILVTLMHLGTSMAFFCLMTLIVLRLRHPSPEVPARLVAMRPLYGIGLAGTYVQILLGGIVRHTSSGLACFGIPFCNGEAWPSHPGAHLHMGHRYFAVLLGVYVLGVAWVSWRRAPGSRAARFARLAAILVLIQITLGVLSVLSLLALSAVTLHLGVAALLLACHAAMLYYVSARSPSTTEARPAEPPVRPAALPAGTPAHFSLSFRGGAPDPTETA